MTRSQSRSGAVLAFLASVVLAITAVQITTHRPAYALGAGKACVFFAGTGAYGLGHTAWAYQIGGSSQWVYGATENYSGHTHTDPGHDIGYWDRQGSWQQTLNAFFDPPDSRIGSGYYTEYKCYPVSDTSVGAANNARHAARCGGYDATGNNSLDHTYRIIHAYNGSIPMPSTTVLYTPHDWYHALGNLVGYWGWDGPNTITHNGAGTGSDPGGHCP